MRIGARRKPTLSPATLVAKPTLPKSARAQERDDVVDQRSGRTRASDVPAPTRGRSALHARLGDVPIANAKKPKNPTDNPEWFWKGKLKWKAPPAGVEVIENPHNKDGRGWIEKWRSPTTQRWVHNYTMEEMERRAGEKFARVNRFAENIDALEEQLERDLKSKDEKLKQTALVVALIHHTYIRVGNEDSAQRADDDPDKQNTYGVTTMLVRHWRDGAFRFLGKAEVAHEKRVEDARLRRLVDRAARGRAPDAPLFDVTAADVNAYLEPFGGHAKDFRTYHATRLAHEAFAQIERDAKEQGSTLTPAERERMLPEVVESVAAQIGHEPSVSRKSYIDPAVIELFVRGKMA
jgi:DNA topoisomerase-1